MRTLNIDLYKFSELSKEVQKPILERRKKYKFTEPPFYPEFIKHYEQVFTSIGFTRIEFYLVHGYNTPAWKVSSQYGWIDVYAMSLNKKVDMSDRDRKFIQRLKNHHGYIKAMYSMVHDRVEYYFNGINRNKMIRVQNLVYKAIKPYVEALKSEYNRQKEILKTEANITEYLDSKGEIFTKEGKVLYIEERF